MPAEWPAIAAAACRLHRFCVLALVLGVTAATDAAGAGQQGSPESRDAARGVAGPRGCSTHISERKTETGCDTTAETPLGVLPSGSLFWHVYSYPSRAAAEAARGPRRTIAESFGKQWLFTIAEESWHPAGG